MQWDQLAGGLGFEPRLAESESAVLPLDDPPVFTNRINHLSFKVVAKFYSLCPDVHSLGSPLVCPSSRPTAALARAGARDSAVLAAAEQAWQGIAKGLAHDLS